MTHFLFPLHHRLFQNEINLSKSLSCGLNVIYRCDVRQKKGFWYRNRELSLKNTSFDQMQSSCFSYCLYMLLFFYCIALLWMLLQNRSWNGVESRLLACLLNFLFNAILYRSQKKIQCCSSSSTNTRWQAWFHYSDGFETWAHKN